LFPAFSLVKSIEYGRTAVTLVTLARRFFAMTESPFLWLNEFVLAIVSGRRSAGEESDPKPPL
jgi:hypothetical protein